VVAQTPGTPGHPPAPEPDEPDEPEENPDAQPSICHTCRTPVWPQVGLELGGSGKVAVVVWEDNQGETEHLALDGSGDLRPHQPAFSQRSARVLSGRKSVTWFPCSTCRVPLRAVASPAGPAVWVDRDGDHRSFVGPDGEPSAVGHGHRPVFSEEAAAALSAAQEPPAAPPASQDTPGERTDALRAAFVGGLTAALPLVDFDPERVERSFQRWLLDNSEQDGDLQ
jgi:hypothetical protein